MSHSRERMSRFRFQPRLEVLEDRLTPAATSIVASPTLIADAHVGTSTFMLTVTYDADMKITVDPTITFPTVGEDPVTTITLNAAASDWTDNRHFVAKYNVVDANVDLRDIDAKVSGGKTDPGDVTPADFTAPNVFGIDTENPTVTKVSANRGVVADSLVGKKTFKITIDFSEDMDETVRPLITFPVEKPGATLRHNSGKWLDSNTYEDTFNVRDVNVLLRKIDVRVASAKDVAGNTQTQFQAERFKIDTRNPKIVSFQRTGFDGSTGIMTYELVFDLPVTGVDAGDFRLEADGLSGAAIRSVTGSSTNYFISVFVGDGFGHLRLKLIDDNTILFQKGRNPLEGSSGIDGSFDLPSDRVLHMFGIGMLI